MPFEISIVSRDYKEKKMEEGMRAIDGMMDDNEVRAVFEMNVREKNNQ